MYQEQKEFIIPTDRPKPKYKDMADAMRRGYAKVGKQCVKDAYQFDKKGEIEAVCALGAASLGGYGFRSEELFIKNEIIVRNDHQGMSIPAIADWLENLE